MQEYNKIKKAKAVLLAFFQNFSEFVSIITYVIFSLSFAIVLIHGVYKYIYMEYIPENFVKSALTSFELLFLAPIPILIVFAFKAIMIKIFPGFFKEPEDDPKNLLKLDFAKKTFISSMVGVLATFILGVFLNENFQDLWSILRVLLFLGFLLILIFYFKLLSAHADE